MPESKVNPNAHLALPQNRENMLAYCDQCKPALGFGFGALNPAGQVKHVDQKTGALHIGKTMRVGSDERLRPNEAFQDFLDRLTKKYVKK